MKGFINLGALIVGGLLTLAGIFGYHPPTPQTVIPLGSATPIQAQAFFLSGSGITSSVTTTILTSFKTPDGVNITTSDLSGGITYATIEPGTAREEQISFTGVTQNADGTATLTGVTRGLAFKSPCNSISTNQKAHAGGVKLVLSNTACFYTQFLGVATTNTISGVQTFTSTSIPLFNAAPTFANPLGFIDKAYVDAVATSGAPDALVGTKGLVELANSNQFAIGSSTSGISSAKLVPWNSLFNATSSATTTGVVTNPQGLISPTFISTSSVYNWTGANSYNGTSTFGSPVIFNASTTFTSTTTLPTTSTLIGTVNLFNNLGEKIVINSTSTSVTSNTTLVEVASTSIPANTLNISNGLSGITMDTVFSSLVIPASGTCGGSTIAWSLKYGNTFVATTTINNPAAAVGGAAEFTARIIASSTASNQMAMIKMQFSGKGADSTSTLIATGGSNEDATVAKTLSLYMIESGSCNAIWNPLFSTFQKIR